MEKSTFTSREGEDLDFYVLATTRLNNTDYILVTDIDPDSYDEGEEAEAEAYILKDLSAPEDEDGEYVFLDDEDEIEQISKLFGEEDDMDYEIEVDKE